MTGFGWWIGMGGAAALGQDAGALLTALDRLDVMGSVLYVAAHPDDENTRLIRWLEQDRGLRTAYLSMTRGGGGQNLIGAEQAERLSVVRTGELLAARSIDGGEQFFTRMRDFGYSKSPEETLRLWGHDEALEDVVRVIRTFRPDIVVTRFASDGGGHGHHTASARLAVEAFERAADPAYEVDDLPPWRARRVLRNESTWRRPDDEPIPDDWMAVDVGTYDPRSGASGGELAALARSQHKSQGFGAAPQVGPILEYFTHTAGDPVQGPDPFADVDASFVRFAGGAGLARRVAKIRRRFDPRHPEESLPALADLHEALGELADPRWAAVKREEVEALMRACAGLHLTARADVVAASPGDSVELTLQGLARRPADVRIVGSEFPDRLIGGSDWRASLSETPATWTATLGVRPDAPPTKPHWLVQPPSPVRYRVEDPARAIVADEPPVAVDIDLEIAGVVQRVRLPVANAITDRVRGEVQRPFEVLPSITASFEARGVLVPRGGAVEVPVTVSAPTLREGTETVQLSFDAPPGVEVTWSPRAQELTADARTRAVTLRIVAGAGAEAGAIVVEDGGEPLSQAHRIAYPHLPERTVLSDSVLAVTPVDLDRGGVERVGYLPGSGDAVPDALRAVGYAVTLLDEPDLTQASLDRFDAVVLGVRAFNTRPSLVGARDALLAWVARGGTLVVQYNTSGRWAELPEIGPAPLEIGRGRVTDETAPVRFVDPDHALLARPNRLSAADFDGWVQERGLYFAETWDDDYQPLFGMSDPDEEERLGATVVGRHGRGTFVYTGLSFFRQLPAGVPGAMRLFANVLEGAR